MENTTVIVDAGELKARLDALLLTNLTARKGVRKLMRDALNIARREVVQGAKGAMRSDPRRAAQGVRTTVWRSGLGGNVNILPSRGAVKTTSYEPKRTLRKGQRGGNRTTRSARTAQMMSYAGASRNFVLRFINGGTAQRTTKYGASGAIGARAIFGSTASRGLEMAQTQLVANLQRAIVEIWG